MHTFSVFASYKQAGLYYEILLRKLFDGCILLRNMLCIIVKNCGELELRVVLFNVLSNRRLST